MFFKKLNTKSKKYDLCALISLILIIMDTAVYLLMGVGALCLLLFLWLRQSNNMAGVGADREHFVPKELYNTILAQHEMLRLELSAKEQSLRDSYAQLAARDQQILHLEQTVQYQRSETERLQQQFQAQFEQVANRLLEEKTERFTAQNAQQLHAILSPLKEKIREFELNIDRKFLEETREKSSLRTEIEQMKQLNQQLSQDAHNLTSALKGQSKMQGDWGELQLEVLLEKSGLERGAHYLRQATFRDETGAAKRPDFIIQLPGDRHLIVDAKVSLTAFERFFNEKNPAVREQHLRAHVQSLRSHIENLSKTNYQVLPQLNSPDYLLLFVPLEQALNTAVQADPQLLGDALDRNIMLVSAGSLMTTMRTVAYLWKQEKQNRSVLEIARQSGLLYDKFVAFVEDLKNIGTRLDGARYAYDEAMHKLVNAARPGDTLIGKAEKIRELGAKSTKKLPQEWINAEEEPS